MNMGSNLMTIARGAVGGAVGYFLFIWLKNHGFYALILPGALLGIGAGYAARVRSLPLAVICGIAGFALSVFTDWKFEPFTDDNSLQYFVMHLYKLDTVTQIMMAIGTFCSFYFALGVQRLPSRESTVQSEHP